jgi:hypothetical protein
VRVAQRKLAERARGLAVVSASLETVARLRSMAKLGARSAGRSGA